MRALVLYGIFLTAPGVTAYDWSFRIDDPIRQERLDTHHGIVSKTARAPERYRVLVPCNTHSLQQIGIAATSWALLLGAFWVYAAMGISRAPAFVRRSALVLPAYLLTILVWGTWVEVRLLLPLYPVVMPLALSYVFEARRS